MTSERGQASIEWVALVCLVTLVLGAVVAVAPVVDGRSVGGFLAARFVCAVRGSACAGSRDVVALRGAYGERDADLVRRFAPGLVYEPGEREVPVDFRRCRAVRCARAPDDRDLDVHRTAAGRAVTVYTRVVHRGRSTYLQYWFYYPDSNSTVLGSDRVWKALHHGLGRFGFPGGPYPGFHLDDWEGYEVRLGAGGRVDARATSHGGLQWCKWRECRGRFGPATGWTRVSRGSHSGHVPLARRVTIRLGVRRGGAIGYRAHVTRRSDYRAQTPGVDLHERTSTPEGTRLVPIETLSRQRYRRLAPDVSPPWQKRLYRDPEAGVS